ncbi:THUMP domain-containing protein 2-like [Argopecten irradians]|uniref:THUMP domain-containing protein 2-like n=1 Tax=Argopecten irradians TaxID=31199 RepID=UPI003717F16F
MYLELPPLSTCANKRDTVVCTRMHFFCSAGRGTEKFVAEEIRRKLNGDEIEVTDGKIFFRADTEVTGAVNQLRSIERAFVQVIRHSSLGGVKSVKDVGKIVLSLDDWTKSDLTNLVEKMHCAKGHDSHPESKKRRIEEEKPLVTFRVSCKCAGRIGRRIRPQMLSRFIGVGLKRLINWKVDLRNPSIEICVHMNDDRLTVGIPLQNIPVSKRNYIRHFGLRGTIAWIMSNLLDIQPGDVVLDPMCGKATILVEACHNFMAASYLGMDINKDQLSKAAENLLWSRLHGIGLVQGDARCIPAASGSIDKVLCDTPFGQNFLPDCDNILEFYKQSLIEISRVLKPGGCLVLLTSQQLSSKVCGLCGQPADSESLSKGKIDDKGDTIHEQGQVKVTQNSEKAERDEQTSIIPGTSECVRQSSDDGKSPTASGDLKLDHSSSTMNMENLDTEADMNASKSNICESERTSVQTDDSNHGDDESRESVLKVSCQGHTFSQGHTYGCAGSSNDRKHKMDSYRKDLSMKSQTFLNRLQVKESHYVKLGETDATICVIHRL